MKFLNTPNAPTPGGHYSQAVEAGGFVFVSGMLPGPGVATDGPDNFDRQVNATLDHCERVLAAANCPLTNVVMCTAYIVDVANWPAFNRLYAARFGEHMPARAVVPVPELHHGFLVELQMTAVKPVVNTFEAETSGNRQHSGPSAGGRSPWLAAARDRS